MPRESFADGQIYNRSSNLSYPQAQAFARCLQANPLFLDVTVQDSSSRRSKSWYVRFRPATAQGVVNQITRQERKNLAKAAEEGSSYEFVRVDRLNWLCTNPLSGQTYLVNCFDCSCPHYQYRLRGVQWSGLKCKHQIELSRRQHAGE